MALIAGGYILQPRKFDLSDVSKMPPCTREVWLFILRNVNWQDNNKFKRGDGFFSIADLQEGLCWYVGFRKMTYTKDQVAKALRRLREGQMVHTTKTTRGMMITVCNYSLYQDKRNYEDHNEGAMKASRRLLGGCTILEEGEEGNSLPPAKPTGRKITFSETDMKGAKFLLVKIQDHSPHVTDKHLGQWANTIRLIREQDKKTNEQITAAIYFAVQDSFWQGNILSATSLRKNMDILLTKANSLER